jgi:hypothetical protein
MYVDAAVNMHILAWVGIKRLLFGPHITSRSLVCRNNTRQWLTTDQLSNHSISLPGQKKLISLNWQVNHVFTEDTFLKQPVLSFSISVKCLVLLSHTNSDVAIDLLIRNFRKKICCCFPHDLQKGCKSCKVWGKFVTWWSATIERMLRLQLYKYYL